MLEIFDDMAEGILDLIGEDAFLAGATVPIKINIEHDVQLAGIGGEEAAYRGDLVAQRDVATIHARHNPRAGQSFVQGDTTWKLEHLVEDNGSSKRFVILKVLQ